MTFLGIFAGLEACLILFMLWVLNWYADKLLTERRVRRAWHDECCYLQGRPMALCAREEGEGDADRAV